MSKIKVSKESFILSKKARLVLQTARQNLFDALNSGSEESTVLAGLNADKSNIKQRLNKSENQSSHTDASQMTAIAQDRIALELLEKRISSFRESPYQNTQKIVDALNALCAVFQPEIKAQHDRLLLECARIILPTAGTWNQAFYQARQCSKLSSFGRFYNTHFGKNADESLGMIDSILAGKNPWKFPVETEPR